MRGFRVFCLVSVVLCSLSCGSSSVAPCRDQYGHMTGQGSCFYSTSGETAGLNAGAAAAAWAIVGCRVNGCNPPYFCNVETKLCERIHCDEDAACPVGYTCNLRRNRCR